MMDQGLLLIPKSAFQTLKRLSIKEPILAIFDLASPSRMVTDLFDEALGA